MKSLRIGLVALLFTINASAHAGLLWTVTTSGKIAYGEDHDGVFGLPGQRLDGFDYVQSVSVVVDPAAWANSVTTTENDYRSVSGPRFTTTVTVNGVRRHWVSKTNVNGGTLIQNSGSLRGYPYFDVVSANLFGSMANGDILHVATAVLGGPNSFVPAPRYDQSFTQAIDQTYGSSIHFTWAEPISESFVRRKVMFNSTNVSMLTVTAQQVPEPNSFGLLLGAIVVLAVSRKCQRVRA